MPRPMVLLLLVAFLSAPILAEVPEGFRGTWSLDEEASMSAIEAASSELTTEQKDRLIRGLTGDLKGMVVEITDSAMTYSISGFSQAFSLVLEKQTGDSAVFSAASAGMITLRIGGDGRLNTRSSKDDDFDHYYFRRQDGAAASALTRPANDSVAYLDALKACKPGSFQLSYPGFGTFDNTIVGKQGDRCQVHIKHPSATLTCNFSDATVALLTTEAKYEEARNGVLSGSTDSEESQRAAAECSPDPS